MDISCICINCKRCIVLLTMAAVVMGSTIRQCRVAECESIPPKRLRLGYAGQCQTVEIGREGGR